VRPFEIDPIDPVLATPAPAALYEVPVLIINYLPTRDGTNVTAPSSNLHHRQFQSKLTLFNKRVKFMLEEGSRYHGYRNANATASLGIAWSASSPRMKSCRRADPLAEVRRLFSPIICQILDRFGAGNWVSNQNVKEIWLWAITPPASFPWNPTCRVRPRDISNSFRDPTDLPSTTAPTSSTITTRCALKPRPSTTTGTSSNPF